MELKDVLLPLVGALWAFTTLAVSLVFEINKIRDKILIGYEGSNPLTLAHRQLLYDNDWKPLSHALFIAAIVFGIFCLSSVLWVRFRWVLCLTALLTGAIPLAMAFSWFRAEPADARAIEAALAAASTNAPAAKLIEPSVLGTNTSNAGNR